MMPVEKAYFVTSEGEVDFIEIRKLLLNSKYKGWCTIEQDCDPMLTQTRLVMPEKIENIWKALVLNKDKDMAKLNWAMVGGGEGSQIGESHRLGAQADGLFKFTAGALTITRGRTEYAQSLGVDIERHIIGKRCLKTKLNMKTALIL